METEAPVTDDSFGGFRRGTGKSSNGGQMNSGGSRQRWIPTESSSGNNSSRAAGVNKGQDGGGKAFVETDGKNSWGPPSVSYDNRRAWSKVHNLEAKPNQAQSRKTNFSSKSNLGVSGGSSGARASEQSFVAYLPQDDVVMDASETQEVVDLLNEQLSNLLCLPSRQFWEKVITDDSLSVFLDSYLQYRKRWFDIQTGSLTKSEVNIVVGDGDLSRRVFMILLRVSSNSEPGAPSSESLSAKEHAEILKDRKLLDIPKLMDTSAIYGHDNPDLTRRLVSNVFKAQPGYADDLAGYVLPLLQRLTTMHQRCCDTVEGLTGSGDLSTFAGANRVHQELLEIVDYLNDVVFTLHAFILVYPPAANILITSGYPNLGSEHGLFLSAFASIHDILLPKLQEGFTMLAKNESHQNEETAASAQLRLNRLRERLVDLVWLLMETRYFMGSSGDDTSTEQSAYDFDDIIAKGDSLVQEIVALAMGPSDHVLAQSGNSSLTCTGSLLKSMERRHGLSYQTQQACQRGALVLDVAQQDYISALAADDQAPSGRRSKGPVETRQNYVPRLTLPERRTDEESVIRQSKISQVKDLFPHFGDGFVDACLEVYDNDPENVIQRILEGTLHPDLMSLDTSLSAKPARLVIPPPVKDKGKGKIHEMTETDSVWEDKPIPLVRESSTISVGGSSSSGSGVSRGKAPVSKITISDENAGRYVRRQKEGDESFSELLDSRSDREDLQRAIKAAAARVEYEDEYDDSFDELGYIADAGGIEETESLADLVASRGGVRNDSSQSRNSGKPFTITPWGAGSNSRDKQISGGPSGRGDTQSGQRQHPGGGPSGKGEYQRGEKEETEQSAGTFKDSYEPRGDRHRTSNIRRSNEEAQGRERRYAAGTRGVNEEAQRGDRRYAAGAPRSEEGHRQYRPLNELQGQKVDRDSSIGPGGIQRYQFGSPVVGTEGQVNETDGNLPAGRGRGGRGNRGRGKNRGPQPKSDFYLKDGKLYSYKVAGAIAVGSVEEAEAIKREERETIYGLGDGGNVPRSQDGNENSGTQEAVDNTGRGDGGRGRGGYGRGRGDPVGRGRGRGGNDNHHRKDKAMQKHFAGLGGL